MRKIISCITLCCIFLPAFSQDQTTNRRAVDAATGNLLYVSQYTEVQGSPFMVDGWLPAKVIFNNSVLEHIQLKFDIYNNAFILNKNDTAYVVSPVVEEVRIYPDADTAAALIFKKGFTINAKINTTTYLQVLAEGKITFLKFAKKELEEYTDYGDATKRKRFNESFQYFIYSNGQYESVQLSRKNIENLLSDKRTMVASFLQQYKLSGKDEKSWSAAIRHYNTL